MENCRINPTTMIPILLAILFPSILFGSNLSSCHGARIGPSEVQTSTAFIRKSCTATLYPDLCFSSLSAYASTIQTSPLHLAQAALSVTLAASRSTSAMMLKISAAGGMAPPVAGAMQDCMETIGDSADELRESLAAMGKLRGSSNMAFTINSIQTWVSAALTNDDTCMDGFAGAAMNGNVKSMVRGHVVKVAKLTSNALAFLSRLASSP